jgi:transcriptional regulator with XRE-family HTH domain
MPDGSITQRIASNVRAEMARRSETQTSLAGKLGRTQSSLSRRLCGQVPFDVVELGTIAKVLNVPLACLVEGADTIEPCA